MGAFADRLYQRNQKLFFALLRVRTLLTLPLGARAISDYLKTASEPKLQLGAGRNHMDGWLNTDYLAKPPKYVYLDATRRFPLPDDRFARIYSEHMIEHIDQKAGENMLRECFRILKPGGRIRLETPDLEVICALYRNAGDPVVQAYVKWHTQNYATLDYPPTLCFAINDALRNWGHCFVYDAEMLRLAMTKAGFVNIKQYSWNVSDDPAFINISKRTFYEFSLFESLVMEAEKPA